MICWVCDEPIDPDMSSYISFMPLCQGELHRHLSCTTPEDHETAREEDLEFLACCRNVSELEDEQRTYHRAMNGINDLMDKIKKLSEGKQGG